MTSADWNNRRTAFIAAGVIYTIITAAGLLQAGLNPDDWMVIGHVSPAWLLREGRFATLLLNQDLLRARFIEPAQIAGAFLLFWWIACRLTSAAVGRQDASAARHALWPPAALSVFLIGVNNLYMCDALNFSNFVLAFPLALSASLAAFILIGPSEVTGPRWPRALRWILATQLLALSMGVYQPFAAFGAIYPLIVLMRFDRFTLRQAAGVVLASALLSVLAAATYLLEWRLAAIAYEVAGSGRFVQPTLPDLLRKARHLAGFERSLYEGRLLWRAAENTWFNRATLALAALTTLASMAREFSARRPLMERCANALRLGLGAGAAVCVLPVLFWFTYNEDYAPGRAAAFSGFLLVSVFLTAASLLIGMRLQSQEPERARRPLQVLFACLLIWAGVQALLAAYVWDDQSRVGRRDLALAASIEGRLAGLPGYHNQPIVLVGARQYNDLVWGSSLGRSAFDSAAGRTAIFRELFNSTHVTKRAESPRPCGAFPDSSSVFLDDQSAYVCLRASEGLFPLAGCAPVGDHGVAEACWRGASLVLRLDACRTQTSPSFFVRWRAGGQDVQADFRLVVDWFEDTRAQQFKVKGECYAVLPLDQGAAQSDFTIGELDRYGAAVWARPIKRPSLLLR